MPNSLPVTKAGLWDKGRLGTLPAEARTCRSCRSEGKDLEAALTQIWERILAREVTRNDLFQDLGGDSVAAVDLLSEIERKIGRPLPPAVLRPLTSVAEFAARLRLAGLSLDGQSAAVAPEPDSQPGPYESALRKNLAGRPGFRRRADSLMVRLNSESKTGNRLFFCANGTAECEPLARELDGEVELWMLESGYGHIPGTQDAIEEISSRHLREILQIVGEGPIQLLGYSFACLHATEIAAQATARGSLVTFLGWLDNRNCFTGVFGLYRHLEVRWENLKWSWLAARGKGTYLRRLGGIILRALTRRLGLCRGESHPPPSAAVHRVLGPCRDPYRILPSRLPLHLFVACDHPLRNSLFPTLGWRRADYPLLRVWKSAGNHHTMGLSGNATTLARVLRHALTVQPTALAACEAPQARALI